MGKDEPVRTFVSWYKQWQLREKQLRREEKEKGREQQEKEREEKEQLEKVKVLYELAKSHYNEEVERVRKMEDKAAKLFSFFALMIGGFGFFGKWVLDSIKYPGGCFEWCLFGVGCLVVTSLTVSGFYSLWVLQVKKVDKPSSDEQTLKDLNREKLKTVYIKLARSYAKDLEAHREQATPKGSYLNHSYYATLVALVCFVILVGFFCWYTLSSKSKSNVDFHPSYHYDCYLKQSQTQCLPKEESLLIQEEPFFGVSPYDFNTLRQVKSIR